jgi:hypothetical protein
MNRPLLTALVAALSTPALALAQTPAAAPPAIKVVDAKVATAVADRETQGAAGSFPAGVGKIYCWTKVQAPAGSEITHVWYRGAEKVNEVKLQLKQPTTRTWSVKTIPAEWTGDWKVEVVGPDGAVLKTVAFKVG